MSGRQRFVFLVPALAILLLIPTAASGHAASQFYDFLWVSDLSVRWKFVSDFPSGNFRERVKDGAQKWNDLDEPMSFKKIDDLWDPYPPADCSPNEQYQKDGVHWGDITDGALAKTFRCRTSSELWTFNIKFDSDRPWYTGTGDPPGDKFDMWGVAVHEFGHATGWKGHFEDSSQYCTDVPYHTMCPSLPSGAQWMRSLESHDTHTFGGAY
jgi:Matrixin